MKPRDQFRFPFVDLSILLAMLCIAWAVFRLSKLEPELAGDRQQSEELPAIFQECRELFRGGLENSDVARKEFDLIWYDGGMRPPTPDELDEDHKQFPLEAMMFVGDKGKILAGFRVENPRLIPEKRMKGLGIPDAPPRRQREPGEVSPGIRQWIAGCKGGKQSPGSFLNATGITEAVNLYAVALRSRQRLLYDGSNMNITNVPEVNKYLSREYRSGWEPKSV